MHSCPYDIIAIQYLESIEHGLAELTCLSQIVNSSTLMYNKISCRLHKSHLVKVATVVKVISL